MTGTGEGEWTPIEYSFGGGGSQIHDESIAGEFGFTGAPIGGTQILALAVAGIADTFGPDWMTGGWLHVKLIGAAYAGDVMRSVLTAEDGGAHSLKVEKRDGTLSAIGEAGMGNEIPWDSTTDGATASEALFDSLPIGNQYADYEFISNAEDLKTGREYSEWFTTGPSPWGGVVLSPSHVFGLGLRAADVFNPVVPEPRVVQDSPMWAEFWIVLDRVMFPGAKYVLTSHLADKGRSGRMVFQTLQFTITDADGNRCARGRQKYKYFVKE